jgi:transposase
MSLKPICNLEIPSLTKKIALASFPKGNIYMKLRDSLGNIFDDNLFEELYPKVGQPTVSPWRLALITILQHGENLSDRQAADAVRSRIDWKYLLSLDIDDSGFDFSVLSEFRKRLIENNAQELIFNKILDKCKELKLGSVHKKI